MFDHWTSVGCSSNFDKDRSKSWIAVSLSNRHWIRWEGFRCNKRQSNIHASSSTSSGLDSCHNKSIWGPHLWRVVGNCCSMLLQESPWKISRSISRSIIFRSDGSIFYLSMSIFFQPRIPRACVCFIPAGYLDPGRSLSQGTVERAEGRVRFADDMSHEFVVFLVQQFEWLRKWMRSKPYNRNAKGENFIFHRPAPWKHVTGF